MYKRFDPVAHAQHDRPAKEVVLRFLRQYYEARINPDIYGPDIVYFVEKDTWFAEVEVKPGWAAGDFPWHTVHIPERKRKFLAYRQVVFFVLRRDMRLAVAFTADAVERTAMVRCVANITGTPDELFFDVPLEHCRIYTML